IVSWDSRYCGEHTFVNAWGGNKAPSCAVPMHRDHPANGPDVVGLNRCCSSKFDVCVRSGHNAPCMPVPMFSQRSTYTRTVAIPVISHCPDVVSRHRCYAIERAGYSHVRAGNNGPMRAVPVLYQRLRNIIAVAIIARRPDII